MSRFERFATDNLALLEHGKALLPLLDQPTAKSHIHKPLMLKIVLEKYIELIEEKLIPVLPKIQQEQQEQQEQQTKVEKVDTDRPAPHEESHGSLRLSTPHTVERIRPRVHPRAMRPLARPKSPTHASSSHLIDDFRGTDPRYRPTQRKINTQRETPTPHPSAPASRREPVNTTAQPTPKAVAPLAGDGPHHHLKLTQENLLESHQGSRRKIPRYSCRIPLAYCAEGKDLKFHKAFSKDVGALGLFILANRPQQAGDSLKIQIELPNRQFATIQATVRWTKWVPQNLRSVDMPGFGVKITSATENWYTYFAQAPTSVAG